MKKILILLSFIFLITGCELYSDGEDSNISITSTDNIKVIDDKYKTNDCECFCIGDRVWFDKNHNGIQDTGERGVSNIKVELWTNDFNYPIATMSTDKDGLYNFCNLSTNTYKVVFKTAGYKVTKKSIGDKCKDSNIDVNGKTEWMVIEDNNLCIDAGIYQDIKVVDARIRKQQFKCSCRPSLYRKGDYYYDLPIVKITGDKIKSLYIISNIDIKLLDTHGSDYVDKWTTRNLGKRFNVNVLDGTHTGVISRQLATFKVEINTESGTQLVVPLKYYGVK
jgi:hypothetical protein